MISNVLISKKKREKSKYTIFIKLSWPATKLSVEAIFKLFQMAVGGRVGSMSWEGLLLPKASTSCPPGERALEKIV